MGLMERIGQGIRAILNRLTGQAEDPEKILKQVVDDMEQDLIQMQEALVQKRQAVVREIASLKRTEQQVSKAESTAQEWYNCAQFAREYGAEKLAQQLLTQQQTYQQIYELTAQALQPQIAEQRELVTELKKNLLTLEKNLLTLESCLPLVRVLINQTISTGKALRAVERIENKLLELEARLEAIAESSSRDCIGREIHINLNRLIGQAEDPEKILEQAISDIQEDRVKLRQAVAGFITTQKRTEQQYNKYKSEANDWYKRAQLALQKGDDNLAREALTRRQTHQLTAQALQPQIAEQREIVTTLEECMRTVETKVSEAKTKKDLYIARWGSAQASV
ncbi:MAG: PspA/IM30 family protein [Coleofasciculus sp. G1-WW12-02]|uniref:PspA/IM30 family protein n=1 Tax=Coleofasciculus sp. G1-WW12-02 TaxID=3068483 RepID=UPI0032F58553